MTILVVLRAAGRTALALLVVAAVVLAGSGPLTTVDALGAFGSVIGVAGALAAAGAVAVLRLEITVVVGAAIVTWVDRSELWLDLSD